MPETTFAQAFGVGGWELGVGAVAAVVAGAEGIAAAERVRVEPARAGVDVAVGFWGDYPSQRLAPVEEYCGEPERKLFYQHIPSRQS